MSCLNVLACWKNPESIEVKCLTKREGQIQSKHLVLGVSLIIAGIGAMTVALLAQAAIIPLNFNASLIIGASGGAMATLGATSTLVSDKLKFDTALKKTCITTLPILAAIALILGSFGLSGHIGFLEGSTGLLLAGSGAIVILSSSTFYCCLHPYKMI